MFSEHYPIRAAAEQTAALKDEAKKLPGKNGAALFDAVPDHTYFWDVLQDKVLGEKLACLEHFFAQVQKNDDDHRGNSMLYNLTDLLRNTREDQVNFARCVYLLARRSCVNGETLPDFSADGEVLLRMFVSSEPVRFARLQFADAFLLNYDQLKGVGVTEVKSENVINRLTSKANPRQIERVVAGSRFGVNIVYNLSDPKEMEEDLFICPSRSPHPHPLPSFPPLSARRSKSLPGSRPPNSTATPPACTAAPTRWTSWTRALARPTSRPRPA